MYCLNHKTCLLSLNLRRTLHPGEPASFRMSNPRGFWLSWLSRLISDSVLRSPMSWDVLSFATLQKHSIHFYTFLYISILRFWFCLHTAHRTFQIHPDPTLHSSSLRFSVIPTPHLSSHQSLGSGGHLEVEETPRNLSTAQRVQSLRSKH